MSKLPLRELVTIAPAEDLKSITSGRNGEYVPFNFYDVHGVIRLHGKEVKNRRARDAIKNKFALLTEERRATGCLLYTSNQLPKETGGQPALWFL